MFAIFELKVCYVTPEDFAIIKDTYHGTYNNELYYYNDPNHPSLEEFKNLENESKNYSEFVEMCEAGYGLFGTDEKPSETIRYCWNKFEFIHEINGIWDFIDRCAPVKSRGNEVEFRMVRRLGNMGGKSANEMLEVINRIGRMESEIKKLTENIEYKIANINGHSQYSFKADKVTENFKVSGERSLLEIREITYREDYCSEELQELIKEGWKLIAVCPQNNQRRPDYVLGR